MTTVCVWAENIGQDAHCFTLFFVKDYSGKKSETLTVIHSTGMKYLSRGNVLEVSAGYFARHSTPAPSSSTHLAKTSSGVTYMVGEDRNTFYVRKLIIRVHDECNTNASMVEVLVNL